jgi:hypothetical protein
LIAFQAVRTEQPFFMFNIPFDLDLSHITVVVLYFSHITVVGIAKRSAAG